MEIIKWANDNGYTMVLSPTELRILRVCLTNAEDEIHTRVFNNLDIDVSPILEEATMLQEVVLEFTGATKTKDYYLEAK